MEFQLIISSVTPIYYVIFTTATMLASVILFEGIKKATAVQVMTVLIGFFTIFIGVFMVFLCSFWILE